MIQQHMKLDKFVPHCFFCGKRISKSQASISFRGHRGGDGQAGVTDWYHLDCCRRVVHSLNMDIETHDAMTYDSRRCDDGEDTRTRRLSATS